MEDVDPPVDVADDHALAGEGHALDPRGPGGVCPDLGAGDVQGARALQQRVEVHLPNLRAAVQGGQAPGVHLRGIERAEVSEPLAVLPR